MRSKILLMTSGALLMLLGLLGTFAPGELAGTVDLQPAAAAALLVQLLAAACLGLGALNWTARGSRIGGIYARSVVTANVMFWTVGGLALAKGAWPGPQVGVMVAAAVALAFAAVFGRLMWGGPIDSE